MAGADPALPPWLLGLWLPADVFRERIVALAEEYDRMQAMLARSAVALAHDLPNGDDHEDRLRAVLTSPGSAPERTQLQKGGFRARLQAECTVVPPRAEALLQIPVHDEDDGGYLTNGHCASPALHAREDGDRIPAAYTAVTELLAQELLGQEAEGRQLHAVVPAAVSAHLETSLHVNGGGERSVEATQAGADERHSCVPDGESGGLTALQRCGHASEDAVGDDGELQGSEGHIYLSDPEHVMHQYSKRPPGVDETDEISSQFSRKRRQRIVTRSSSTLFFVQSPMNYIAKSKLFGQCIGTVIFLNVIFMGYVVENAVRDARKGAADESAIWLQVVELIFCGIYLLELAIRLMAFGRDFFLDSEHRAWNLLDSALVIQSVLDASNILLDTSATGTNLSFLRATRVTKVLKALRVLRLLSILRELRLMILLIIGSFRSMIWSLGMLTVMCYVFSLIIVQGVADAAVEGGFGEDQHDDAFEYWGSIGTGMLTLFMAIGGGIDWRAAFQALKGTGALFQCCFLLYIVWFMFVMMNLITAVIVESALSFGGKDFQNSIARQMMKKQEYEDSLRLLFEEMDVTGRGEVSMDEFLDHAENPELRAFFSSLDLEICDASHFFYMLTEHGTSSITLSQFVSGCIRMRGQALAFDLNVIGNVQERMKRNVEQQFATVTAGLDEQRGKLSTLSERLESLTTAFGSVELSQWGGAGTAKCSRGQGHSAGASPAHRHRMLDVSPLSNHHFPEKMIEVQL